MKKTIKKKKVKVDRVTMARLYNTGNYEHVRYELSAEVPDDSSAVRVLTGLATTLKALNPKCPVSEAQICDLQKRVNMPLEDQEKYYGFEGDVLMQKVEADKKELADIQAELREWNENRRTALKQLDDLTGVDVDDGTPF